MTTNVIHTRKQTLDLFSTPADGPPAASDEGRQWTQVFSVRLVRERALDTPIVTTPADVARVCNLWKRRSSRSASRPPAARGPRGGDASTATPGVRGTSGSPAMKDRAAPFMT